MSKVKPDSPNEVYLIREYKVKMNEVKPALLVSKAYERVRSEE